MSVRSPHEVVDQFARLAAGAEPPGIDDSGARRLVERAVIEGAEPQAPPRYVPWRALAWSAVAVVAVCVAFFAWPSSRPPASAEPALSHLSLPTGDQLIGASGARFDIEEVSPASRRVRLREGTLVFDVARAAAGQRFEVMTDHVQIRVTGTVFSVAADAGSSRVHVFEGAVEVVEQGRRHALAAGESWPPGSRVREPAAILAAGEQAAALRARAIAIRNETGSGTAETAGEEEEEVEVAAAAEPHDATADAAVDAAQAEPPAVSGGVAGPIGPRTIAKGGRPPRDATEADTLDAARAHVVAGQFELALAAVDRATARGPLTAPWLLVRADALRGLGRAADAARAFDAASASLTGSARTEAAYTAAYLRFHSLRDAAAALATLDRSDVDDPGSPLEERGIALRAQVYMALGRTAQATASAQRYLERFPHGGMRAYMRSLITRAQ